ARAGREAGAVVGRVDAVGVKGAVRAVLAVVAAAALALGPGASASGAKTIPHAVLWGNGLGGAWFGESSGSMLIPIEHWLHSDLVHESSLDESKCGVTSTYACGSLTLYIDYDTLIGYSLGFGGAPMWRTVKGLGPGDTLARAKRLYGARLTTSSQQGGEWFATTTSGPIEGFLSADPSSPNRAHILSIDAGLVGCPATSP
ncbi:MAG: hypothetical protein ACRDV0_06630, partial [Acidimicrobiales bacterium]